MIFAIYYWEQRRSNRARPAAAIGTAYIESTEHTSQEYATPEALAHAIQRRGGILIDSGRKWIMSIAVTAVEYSSQ